MCVGLVLEEKKENNYALIHSSPSFVCAYSTITTTTIIMIATLKLLFTLLPFVPFFEYNSHHDVYSVCSVLPFWYSLLLTTTTTRYARIIISPLYEHIRKRTHVFHHSSSSRTGYFAHFFISSQDSDVFFVCGFETMSSIKRSVFYVCLCLFF